MRSKLFGALLSACLASTGFGQVTQKGKEYLLRVHYKPGQTVKFASTTTASFPGASKPMVTSMPMQIKVLSVRKNVADADCTIGPGVMNGSVMGRAQASHAKIDDRGRIITGNTPILNLTMPAGPVKIGQTWGGDISLAGATGAGGDMEATFTFKGLKKEGNRTVAVIQLGLKMQGMLSGTGTGLMKLDPADGQTLAADLNLKLVNPMASRGSQAPANVKMTIAIRRK